LEWRVRVDLDSDTYVEGFHHGMSDLDKVTVISPRRPPLEVTWGSVIAHTNGAVLENLPEE
jgi:hypothetical protein